MVDAAKLPSHECTDGLAKCEQPMMSVLRTARGNKNTVKTATKDKKEKQVPLGDHTGSPLRSSSPSATKE